MPLSTNGTRYPRAAVRNASLVVSPRSTCSTNAGQACECSVTDAPVAATARSYAPLLTVASVPMRPITPFRVAWTAVRVPGSMTPTTGMPARSAMSPRPETSTELHATTSIFTSRCTR